MYWGKTVTNLVTYAVAILPENTPVKTSWLMSGNGQTILLIVWPSQSYLMSFHLINWDSLTFCTLLTWRNIYRQKLSIHTDEASRTVLARTLYFRIKVFRHPLLTLKFLLLRTKLIFQKERKDLKYNVSLKNVIYWLKFTNWILEHS